MSLPPSQLSTHRLSLLLSRLDILLRNHQVNRHSRPLSRLVSHRHNPP